MFREMRRANKALIKDECETVLKNASSGVLALLSEDGYPYSVPLSFVYEDGKLYFHCANEGHKIDCIKNCDKASFCVVSKDDVKSERLTTEYESVIVFGRVHKVEDEKIKLSSIKALGKKYAPQIDSIPHIEKYWKNLTMLEFDIEHMTGKKAK